MSAAAGRARDATWAGLGRTVWDVIVVGGGITGAGVAREAVRRGFKTLLIEQTDYSWGTSSRSSKMVHGGLRYLAQGEARLTWHALTERERLIREAPGLVDRLGYHFAHFRGTFPGRWPFQLLLAAYDLLAGFRDHRFQSRQAFLARVPGYRQHGLTGASRYTDAVTDDARLTLRLLDEARAEGLTCLNYVKASRLLMAGDQVCGLHLENRISSEGAAVAAKVVINATGAWADRLRRTLVDETRVRPLRGSHLVLPASRLPLSEAILCHHPDDGRVMFIYPWEGRTIVGTTDLDHPADLDIEAVLDHAEMLYLLRGANVAFPAANLTVDDIIATWSGVRPIIAAGDGSDPSRESRGHRVWSDRGLITVTGGKLTTFRLIALDALRAAAPALGVRLRDDRAPSFAAVDSGPCPPHLDAATFARLVARYGRHVRAFVETLPAAECVPIADTTTLIAELRWACRHEQVVHLDDLLLRRVRVGLLLPAGGLDALPGLDRLLAEELGWDAARCQSERTRYLDLCARYYGLPVN